MFRHTQRAVIDVRERMEDLTAEATIPADAPFILQPGEFVLGALEEFVEVADNIVARIEGKSSLGRLGLIVETAGYVDPGWEGRLTLELLNVNRLPITLYRGMEIAQVVFSELTTSAERPYGTPGLGSKYQGDTEAVASRYYMEGGR